MAPAIGPGIGVAYLRGPLGPAAPPPPATVPAKMAAPVVTAGNNSATVDRADTTANGGSPITRYLIRHSIDPMMMPATTIEQTTDPQTVSGLTNGVLHYFQTAAENAVGQGPWSDTASVTPLAPATAPAKMAAPVLTAGDGSISVDRANTTADGGSAITRYDLRYATAASMAGATTVEQTADPQTVSGLTNGTAYYVQTRAVNAVGAGEWSDAASATPVAAQATVFADDFSRADQTLGTSPNWSRSGGSAGVATVRDMMVQFTGVGEPDTLYAAPDTGAQNHFAQIQNKMPGGVSLNGFPLVICAIDENNFIGIRPRGTNWQVLQRVAGAFTSLNSGGTINVDDIWRAERVGNQVNFYRNGALSLGPFPVPTALQGATRAGLVVRADSRNPVFDNWQSGAL